MIEIITVFILLFGFVLFLGRLRLGYLEEKYFNLIISLDIIIAICFIISFNLGLYIIFKAFII